MIVHLIASLIVSAIVLLMLWIGFRTWKRPMPRYLVPAALAVTAIGYGIYAEYTWESRTLAQLPDSMTLVHRHAGTSAFSPWSYVIPRTDRFSAVDTESVRRNPAHADLVMVDMHLFQRFQPVITSRQLIDCQAARRSDVPTTGGFDSDGMPKSVRWVPLKPEHVLQVASCSGARVIVN